MLIKTISTTALVAPFLISSLSAQQLEGGGDEFELSDSNDELREKGMPPFVDPGNETAKAVASSEGISVGEATNKLRLQQDTMAVDNLLLTQYPDTFSAVRISDAPPYKLILLFSGSQPDRSEVQRLFRANNVTANFSFGDARVSAAKKQRVAGELKALFARSKDVFYTLDVAESTITVMTPLDDNELLQVGEIAQRYSLRLQYSPDEEPRLIANVGGGISWNGKPYTTSSGSYTNHCTTGFTVYGYEKRPDAYGRLVRTKVKGVTTAGHCTSGVRFIEADKSTWSPNAPSKSNMYMYDWNSNSGTADLTFDATEGNEWISGNDLQFHGVEDGHSIIPYYWKGDRSIPVTARAYGQPSVGASLCKHGRETDWDCGKVTNRGTSTDGTPWFSLRDTTTNKDMGIPGDSGGPVASGSTAWGWMYKASSDAKVVYAIPISHMYATTNLTLVGCTTCTAVSYEEAAN